MPRNGRIAVVGASIAGVTAVEELRALGHDGPITLIGDEAGKPYGRPPLSKGILKGTDSASAAYLPDLRDDAAELLSGVAVRQVDLDRRRLELRDGDSLTFEGLVIATGARARTMRELALCDESVATETVLRSLDDSEQLARALARRPTVVVVGAGFMGMEIASAAIDLGAAVTVVDRVAPLLAQCGPELSRLVAHRAQDSGVTIIVDRLGARLTTASGATAVVLGDGTVIEADLVVSAVGDLPNTEWLQSCGVATPRGVVVDDRCRVNNFVVAAGDVTTRLGPNGEQLRNPHWFSAIQQAQTAAAALLHGDDADPYVPRPYVWTNQFGLNLKMCGQFPPAGEPETMLGSIDDFNAVLQWSQPQLRSAAAINRRIPIAKLHAYAGQA